MVATVTARDVIATHAVLLRPTLPNDCKREKTALTPKVDWKRAANDPATGPRALNPKAVNKRGNKQRAATTLEAAVIATTIL